MSMNRADGSASYQAWNAALLMEDFTYYELGAAASLAADTVGNYVREWMAQGLAEKVGTDPDGRVRCRLVDADARRPVRLRRDGSATRQQTKHGNMWTAMRGLREFSPIDIAAHACTIEVHVTDEDAREYCRMLVLAGYLKVLRKAQPGRKPAMYRLMRNTGPQPPRERRVRAVYDDNLHEFAYVAGGAR